MTDEEKSAIRAIIAALYVPRNRFGRLDGGAQSRAPMSKLDRLRKKLPHGGADTIDQAAMLLQILIGDEPTSILDAEQKNGEMIPRKRGKL